MSSESPPAGEAFLEPVRGPQPRYRTWIRSSRLIVFAALSGLCLVATALAVVSPWFALFLVPFALFGYIALILALTVYRFSPRGGDFQRRIHELIVAKAGLPAASQALDVGCGSGSLVVKLAKASPGSTVTGVDSWGQDWEYSKDLCEDNARIEGVAERTAFFKQSGAALEFPDGGFDAVVSCLTFHEIGDVARKSDGVVEALRVLRPGGRYVFLDLFGDPAFYPSLDGVREAVGRADASIVEFGALADALPLPFPLRHPKVLGHAMVIVGVKSAG
ncbi:methyltransferase domain-containing protein [Streptosporangiaceae bacterium NEAU-GS5]|nr:methyltransferase domain-containing protein [Streptosporangiaceae bacterium NEAU-GS5]